MFINTITRDGFYKNSFSKGLTTDELEWILENGTWDDNGNWIDTAQWKDS